MIYSVEVREQLNRIERRCEACFFMATVAAILALMAVALPFGIWGMCG